MALLALDDTDTADGGCTTWTAYRVVRRLVALGPAAPVRVSGRVRLVRLDPAAPYRTRGNGAVVIPVEPVDQGGASEAGDEAITSLGAVVRAVLPSPGAEEADPQPAALWLPGPAERGLYETAVARLVSHDEAWASAPAGTVRLHGPEPRRGEIGALAAAAWPMERATFEAIHYRDPEVPRDLLVDEAVFRAGLGSLAGGFDHVAVPTQRLRAVPRTPCPVLCGVRGTDDTSLDEWSQKALRSPRSVGLGAHEGGWVLATNQATADHVRYAGDMGPRAAGSPDRYRCVVGSATVAASPHAARGGHVFVEAIMDPEDHDAGFRLRLLAYEPTKRFRHDVLELRPGDVVRFAGRIDDDAAVVALEGFQVGRLSARSGAPNPRCDQCGRAMKSAGRLADFRCRPCGTRAQPDPSPGSRGRLRAGAWYQVDDAARGHLLPPLAWSEATLEALGAPQATTPPLLFATG